MARRLIDDERELILVILGYSALDELVVSQLGSLYTHIAIETALQIVNQLEEIDRMLIKVHSVNALGIKRVEDIEFVTPGDGGSASSAQLRAEGSRLLKYLANLLSIPLLFNRYTGEQPGIDGCGRAGFFSKVSHY